ncbi:MAG: glycosyltransferase [Dehalococcoidia bacterium]
MYGTLALTPKALEDYRPIIGEGAVDEIRQLAAPLKGLRVLHLSVTAFGTGVAELLNAAVPLLSDVGLACDWQVVRPAEESAAANKALYQALAGADVDWSPELGEVWLRYSAMNADLMSDAFDVIVVHDPQPAAIRSFVPEAARRKTRWVFHSHLDLSSAHPDAWALLRDHVTSYDAVIFDTNEFVHQDLRAVPVTLIPPAIDPIGPRNMYLSDETVTTILERYGIDPTRPLLCQLSPCDPACDMQGAIDVLDMARRDAPGLQLALIASSSPEDAASIAYFDETVRKSMEYADVHILRGVSEVGNAEVNAFQRASSVVVQMGLRKGFGIWIADAQWKERPVVAARAGGLVQQVMDGETGFLADTTDEFAERVTRILRDPDLARRLGRAGHAHVASHFLITRFLADELRLLTDITRGGR